jgi:hypothetical protein
MEVLENSALYKNKVRFLENFPLVENYPFKLFFSLHSLRFKIETKCPLLKEFILKEFQTIDSKCSDIITIKHSGPSDFLVNSELFSNESSSLCYQEKRDHSLIAIQRDFAVRKKGNIFTAIFDSENTDGLHNLLRWILPLPLLKKEKAIIHSSSLLEEEGNRAFVFLGPSGAGKTTVTSLGKKRIVLGDDMNALHITNNNTMISPGGIGGLFSPQVSIQKKFPIKAFYWLYQDSQNKIVPINKTQAANYLLTSLPHLHWEDLTKTEENNYLNFVEKIINTTPFYKLYFTKDDSFWKVLN